MNQLYQNYPSSTKHLKLTPAKNPTKTFIGGLIIGTLTGSIITALVLGTLFINLYN